MLTSDTALFVCISGISQSTVVTVSRLKSTPGNIQDCFNIGLHVILILVNIVVKHKVNSFCELDRLF